MTQSAQGDSKSRTKPLLTHTRFSANSLDIYGFGLMNNNLTFLSGGVLDRIDSVTATIPFVVLFFAGMLV